MFTASTTMAGTGNTTATTDVCKTPSNAGPTPIAYPNLGQLTTAVNFALTVSAVKKPALNLKSEVPVSSGDEAGTLGGTVSGVNIGPVGFAKGSAMVSVEGLPWVHLTSTTKQNGKSANIVGIVGVASQAMVSVGP